ncbi:YihY/virulence factor BrkB family protein [Comamonadaceae bacterium OTU4NAUVB1]|nr:YihY/virulence factor BrkB family protein [Comamonadaceae bacterium OTU4NAUVB1]HSU24150.1 YihY/virulence factor BrkB family protein [Variovorax sp.]
MSLSALLDLFKQAFLSWKNDYAPSMGAALAYYTIFSVAPLLLIVISVAGLVFGRDAARGEIFAQLAGLMGAQGALAVQGMLEAVNKPMEGIVATVVGVSILVIGATTVFGELQDAMDRIWRAPAREESSGVWSIVRVRLLSFSMVMGIGFLLMVSLIASAALAALGKWWAPIFGGWATLAQAVNFLFSFAMVTVVFAMIYKLMPRVKVEWRDVWTGAGVTALLFTIGKHLIGLYIGKSSVASGYGAAGSLVVVLVWVYYSAQIFLLGAEFTWVYAQKFGSLRHRPQDVPAPVGDASRGTPPERGDLPSPTP